MDITKVKIKRSTSCYFLIYLFFIINVAFNIKSMYLWGDESFTFHMINHSFLNIIYLTSLDVHPFLYYFIAKVGSYPFKSLIYKIITLRIISAIPYLILLIIGNTTIKHRFSNGIAILFMFSIISMPTLVQNIYQIRMYGWVMLFTTIVFILFVYISKQIISNSFKTFLIVTSFSLLASYTHYYGLIIVTIIYILFFLLFLFNHNKIRYLIISALIDVLLYTPQLFILFKQTKSVSRSYWSQPMTLKIAIKDIINIFNPIQSKDIFLIFGAIIAVTLFIIFIKTWDKLLTGIYIGIALPFIVLLIGIIFSFITGHTVLQPRYLTPAMSIFWLCVSILLNKYINYNNLIKFIVLGLVISLGLGAYADNLHQIYKASNQFSSSLNVYNKIPKNSLIIYDNSTVMNSSSSYLKDNKTLGNRYNDLFYPVYRKVFNNIGNQNTCKLPKHKNVFFIRINKQGRKKEHNTESELNNKFYNEYKHEMDKIGEINLINDGGKSTVYRISK